MNSTTKDNVLFNPETGALIIQVSFDVALTVTEGTGNKAGIGIYVGPFGGGAKHEATNTNEKIHRVQFTVPLEYPAKKKVEDNRHVDVPNNYDDYDPLGGVQRRR